MIINKLLLRKTVSIKMKQSKKCKELIAFSEILHMECVSKIHKFWLKHLRKNLQSSYRFIEVQKIIYQVTKKHMLRLIIKNKSVEKYWKIILQKYKLFHACKEPHKDLQKWKDRLSRIKHLNSKVFPWAKKLEISILIKIIKNNWLKLRKK